MPIERVDVSGYTEFGQTISHCLKDGKQIFIYFVGDRVDGKSWCPDCVASDAFMEDVLKKVDHIDAGKPRVFITCFVGDRDTWKNPINPFRVELGLKSIPSFMEYNCAVLDEDKLTPETALKTLSDTTKGTLQD